MGAAILGKETLLATKLVVDYHTTTGARIAQTVSTRG